MPSAIQISWRHVHPSPEVVEQVERGCRRLQSRWPEMKCEVLIDRPHRRHRKGNHHLVRVRAALPGQRATAQQEPQVSHPMDLVGAVNDAFSVVERRLQARRRRQVQQQRAA